MLPKEMIPSRSRLTRTEMSQGEMKTYSKEKKKAVIAEYSNENSPKLEE